MVMRYPRKRHVAPSIASRGAKRKVPSSPSPEAVIRPLGPDFGDYRDIFP